MGEQQFRKISQPLSYSSVPVSWKDLHLRYGSLGIERIHIKFSECDHSAKTTLSLTVHSRIKLIGFDPKNIYICIFHFNVLGKKKG